MMQADGRTEYGPGDWYENVADTLHTKEFGPDGVTGPLAKN